MGARYQAPLITFEAALSEACFLIRSDGGNPALVTGLIRRGVLAVRLSLADEWERVDALIAQYSPRMSLADACVVRLSELHPDASILTTDRTDFAVYRRHGRQAIPFVAP